MNTHHPDNADGPIRVMRIIARLNIGGPAIHVSLLTAGLNDDGFISTLVTGVISETEGDMSDLAADYGINPVIVPSMQREITLLADLRTLFTLIRLMRQARPHIVHTHTAKAGLVGRMAAFLTRVPVIVHTFHGHVFHGYFGALKSRFFIVTEQLVARITDAVITISEGLRAELLDYRIAPPERIHVVPLGLDLARFAAPDVPHGTLRAELGCSPEVPLVGMIGRLVPIKNHELLLDAALLVREALPEVQFVIVGGGERLETLKTIVVDMGLSDTVHFTGWRRDLPAVYADLDVLALTSNNEGTPVSIIEAMAAGVPVVATAVGGVRDVLEEGTLGILVPPKDAVAFGHALIDALTVPQEHIETARQSALARYDASRLVADMQMIYQNLLGLKGARPNTSVESR